MPGLNHNIKRTHDFESLRIEGTIPAKLKGTLYRVGPGLVERFGRSVHPFLADGLITAVDIQGNARGACELVKSDKFLEEERAGRSFYDPNAPFFRRIYNGLTRNIKNTGNTHVLAWQSKLYALMEQGQPVEFDSNNLATIGTNDLGIIKGSFSAHPHRVELLRTTFNFGIHGNSIVIYALPDEGAIRKLCCFKAPWASLIHDFCVTTKHALFFIDPTKMVAWRAILGLKDFSKYFYWDEKESSMIIVIPFDNPCDQRRIEVDPFRVWHFANAFEAGEEIVVDAFRHKNIDVLTAPTELNSDITPPKLYRFRIAPRTKRFSSEPMWDAPCEFPSVNPHFVGVDHRYVWMQSYADEKGNEGFARFDIKTRQQRRYFAPDMHLVSEPMFVPCGQKEDDGWILQLTQDRTIEKSYLAIFDTHSIGEKPIAKLWFDQGIPATFHGVFVPCSLPIRG